MAEKKTVYKNGDKVQLKSWKGDYLHRPDSEHGVTSWNTGVGNEWIIESIDNNKIKLKSWKGDYLYRPDSPQGVTSLNTGVGNEWIVENIDNGKVKLKSWKGDYLHRPDSQQGVTTWNTGVGNEWIIQPLSVEDGDQLPTPIHYWAVNQQEDRNKFKDEIGNLNGEIHGATWVKDGDRNVLEFDGVDNYIKLQEGKAISSNWSASFWIKRLSNKKGAILFASPKYSAKLGQWQGKNQTGITRFNIGTEEENFDQNYDYSPPLNTWVHLIYVGASKETKLYVNGSLQEKTEKSIPLPLEYLGMANDWNTIESLHAMLDEVIIFSEALNEEQVQKLYDYKGRYPTILGKLTEEVLKFDGKSGRVKIPISPLTIPTQFTLEAWVKPSSGCTKIDWPTIFSFGRWGISLGIKDKDGKALSLESWVNNANKVISSETIQIEEWSHVALSYSQGKFRKFYINGKEAGESSSAPAIATGLKKILLLGDADVAKESRANLKGLITEVRFWNHIRNEKQIQELMHHRLGGLEQGLIGYWAANQIEGEKLKDTSQEPQNGDLSKGATWIKENAKL